MDLDFARINKERVGYTLEGTLNPSATGPSTVHELHVLTFEGFIPPYAHEATSHQQVYDTLEQSLHRAVEQQDTVLDGARSVMLDVLATAVLQREAMMNAMVLIAGHYL